VIDGKNIGNVGRIVSFNDTVSCYGVSDVYEVWWIHGVRLADENQSDQREICPVSFSAPQFSHGLAWWNDML